jgi:hypothetical protein
MSEQERIDAFQTGLKKLQDETGVSLKAVFMAIADTVPPASDQRWTAQLQPMFILGWVDPTVPVTPGEPMPGTAG